MPELKWRKVNCRVGKQLGHRHGEDRDLTEIWDMIQYYSLFCEGFLNSGNHKLPTLGTREWGEAIFPCPSALTDFSEQHSTPSGGWSHLTKPCPTAPTILEKICLRHSAAGPTPRRPAQTTHMHQLYLIIECSKSSVPVEIDLALF